MAERLVRPVLVGRQREAGAVEARRRQAEGGRAPARLAGGGRRAGVGKTGLVDELGRNAADGGARVLVGRCVPLGGDGLPFAPLVDALRQLVRTTPPTKLDDLLGPARSELARLLPELEPATAPGD